ncbi:hypothetical protein DFQ27_009472 [Actinomortierella ambigua]|uniref:BZIP domain-containing protein n=1 Tax=Actinomortierella ambigua TaxID=1343610 RepID=A0A9P6PQE4_9FUNG|nr:hypothetical protein DFQ27_009472 [Actinomortierella ambigua]
MTSMNTSHNALSAAERLLKSADSLDFALTSNQDKKALASANGQTIRQGLFDLGNFDSLFEGANSDLSTNLFDDWLSNDLQQVGFAGQSDISDAESSSPATSMRSLDDMGGESPVIGFDSIASDLVRSPAYDAPLAFFPEMQTAAAANTTAATTTTAAVAHAAPASVPAPSARFSFAAPATPAIPAATTPMLPLTPEAVQQAAAALNIPWSKGLEEAVLAQSLLASIPMALGLTPKVPASPMTPAIAAIAAAAAAAPPKPTTTVQERDVQALTALSAAAAASRAEAASKAAALLASSASPSLSSASASPASSSTPSSAMESPLLTPRRSLSILSTTRTTSPAPSSSTGTIQATTYKSSYRSTSLLGASRGLKRSLEYEDPPSVLDGKDVDTMDEAALKRAKNTDAARRSRRKKLLKMEGLEQRVAELEVENSMFESKLNEVELERSLLADKDMKQQARIQELEKMLADVRASLLPKSL